MLNITLNMVHLLDKMLNVIDLLGHSRKERSDEQRSFRLSEKNVCCCIHGLCRSRPHWDVEEPTCSHKQVRHGQGSDSDSDSDSDSSDKETLSYSLELFQGYFVIHSYVYILNFEGSNILIFVQIKN